MDWIQWIFIIIVLLFFIIRFLPVKGVTNITVEEAKNLMKNKQIQFIDVRTPGEFRAFHRKPFQNIPLANLPTKAAKLDKNKEVVVICQSGMRSVRAAKILKKQGFDKVYNVKGGMSAWY